MVYDRFYPLVTLTPAVVIFRVMRWRNNLGWIDEDCLHIIKLIDFVYLLFILHMMAKKKLTEIKFDELNFNKGSVKGNALLEKSLQKFGFREAATLDKNGVLIGGNKRTAKAGEIGMEEVEIIKADPSKVYALQYDDIDIDTPQGRELALALNQTAKENIVFDAEVIEATLEEAVIEEWGIEKPKHLEQEVFDEKEIEGELETKHQCPKCGYEF